MSEENADYKVKDVLGGGKQSAFQKYRDVYYGEASLGAIIWSEFVTLFISWVPGALGLALRTVFYPTLFPSIGRHASWR